MDFFVTINDAFCETVINKSRFLGYAYRVCGELEVQERLKELRKKYYDATHICYAYILDIHGNIAKSSDGGEPSGTAGVPIMEALKASGCKQTLVAVVRYFGGIKLGAGGLIRAYADSAAKALRAGEKVEFHNCNIYKTEVDYNDYNIILRALENNSKSFKLINSEFLEKITVEFAVKRAFDFEAFINNLFVGKYGLRLERTEFIKE